MSAGHSWDLDVIPGSGGLEPTYCPDCDSALRFVRYLDVGNDGADLRLEHCGYCRRDYRVANLQPAGAD